MEKRAIADPEAVARSEVVTITVAQAMDISGLSRSYLYRKFATGELKRLKAGKRVLMWRADFVSFL